MSHVAALHHEATAAPEELQFDDDLDRMQFRASTLTPLGRLVPVQTRDGRHFSAQDGDEILLGADAFEDEVAKRAQTNAVLGALDALLQDGSLLEERKSTKELLGKVQKELSFVTNLFSTTSTDGKARRSEFVDAAEKKALAKFDLVKGTRRASSEYEYRKSEEHGALGYIRRLGKDVQPLFVRKRIESDGKTQYDWSLDRKAWQTVQSNIELSGKRAGAETSKRNMKLIKALADVEAMHKTHKTFEAPSLVDIVVAVLFGLINGAFMGMGDMFRTALRHPACAPLFEKLTVTFTKTCQMAVETVQGMFSAAVRDRLNLTRVKLWERLRLQITHLLKDLWSAIYKCRPLLMVVGVMIVVLIIAFAVTAALAATGFGLIVKVAEIILSLFFSVAFVFSTIKKLWTTMRHCLNGMCTKANAIVIVEHIAQLVGIVLGCIFLGSIPKLVQVKNLKNIFKTKNLTQKFGIRFDPTLIKEFQAFKQTMSAVKGKIQSKVGGKVSTGITAGNQRRAEAMYAGAKRAFKEAEKHVRDAENALDDAVAALEKVRASKRLGNPTGIPSVRERRALERVDAAKRQVEQMRNVEHEAKAVIDDVVRSFPLDHHKWVVDDAIGVVVYEQRFVRNIMDDVSNFASTTDDIERALASLTKLRGKENLSTGEKLAMVRQRRIIESRSKDLIRSLDSMDEQFKLLQQNRKNALPSRDDDLFDAWYAFHRPHSDGFVLAKMSEQANFATSKLRYGLGGGASVRTQAMSKEEQALYKVAETLSARVKSFQRAEKLANKEAHVGWELFVKIKLEVISEMTKLKDLVLSGQIGGGVSGLFIKSDYKKLGEDKSDYEFEYTIDITGLKDIAMFSPDGYDFAPRILLSTDPGTLLGIAEGESALQEGLTHVGGRESMTYYTNQPGELHIYVYAVPIGTKTGGKVSSNEPFLPFVLRRDFALDDVHKTNYPTERTTNVPFRVDYDPAENAADDDDATVEVESETQTQRDTAASQLAAVADADVLVSNGPRKESPIDSNLNNMFEQIRRHRWDANTIDIARAKPVAAGSTNLAKISAETTVKVVIPLIDMRSKVKLESGIELNTDDKRDWADGKGSIEVEIRLQFQRTKSSLSLRPTLLTDAAAENTNDTPFKDLRTLFIRLGKSAKLSQSYVFWIKSNSKRSLWSRLNPFSQEDREFGIRIRTPVPGEKIVAHWTYRKETHWTPVSHHVQLEGKNKGKLPPKDIVLLIRGLDYMVDSPKISVSDWEKSLAASVEKTQVMRSGRRRGPPNRIPK